MLNRSRDLAMNIKQISKFMSYVLRHDPASAGLEMDQQGWVNAHDLVLAIQKRNPEFTHDDLEGIVVGSEKQRFDLLDGMIRANQGHSVSVDLDLKPETPPAKLYHGTSLVILDIVLRDGLKKMLRHHVHLSPDIETARIVGARRPGTTVILEVDTTNMTQEFYVSKNGVWLTDAVAPEHLKILTKE